MSDEKILAFCNDYPNQPGDSLLNEFLNYGIKAVRGSDAIKLVRSGEILPENVYVAQEILAQDAKNLIRMGAKPFILTSGETSIWAPLLFDNLKNESAIFKYRLLYEGSYKTIGGVSEFNHHYYFTSFSQKEELKQVNPWNSRKDIVMVVANKYCRIKFPTSSDFNKFMVRLKTCFSKSFHKALKNNLQKNRLEAIEFFGNLKKLDLYGANWNKKKDIPNKYWKGIKDLIPFIYKGMCDDKIDVISKYKFSLAFENMSSEGYVTEKIIDCFVAGVIPIYWGAPDIANLIPKKCFIDVRDFENYEKLDEYIANLSEEEAMDYIKNGRDFLQSDEGKKYSREYFVEFISNLFQKEIQK